MHMCLIALSVKFIAVCYSKSIKPTNYFSTLFITYNSIPCVA